MNQLNTVGMDLIDDIRSSIQGASTDSLDRLCRRMYMDDSNMNKCVEDKANSFVSVTKRAKVTVNGSSIDDIPVYGAFCTGTYTYIWNSGYFEDGEHAEKREVVDVKPVSLQYGEGDDKIIKDFRLLKVYDRDRTICVNANKKQDTNNSNAYVLAENRDNSMVPEEFEIDNAMISGEIDGDKNIEGGVELLKNDPVSDLVLYDFYMTKPAISSTRENLFFAGSFILGTRRGGVNITTSGDSCKPPTDEYSDLEYCAINRFNFAVQAGGD